MIIHLIRTDTYGRTVALERFTGPHAGCRKAMTRLLALVANPPHDGTATVWSEDTGKILATAPLITERTARECKASGEVIATIRALIAR